MPVVHLRVMTPAWMGTSNRVNGVLGAAGLRSAVRYLDCGEEAKERHSVCYPVISAYACLCSVHLQGGMQSQCPDPGSRLFHVALLDVVDGRQPCAVCAGSKPHDGNTVSPPTPTPRRFP
jgi:hypothetical protein